MNAVEEKERREREKREREKREREKERCEARPGFGNVAE